MTTARNYARVTRAIERRQWSSVGSTFDGEFVVRAYSIISTDLVVLNVWEPIDWSSHACSFRDDEYGMLGAVRSRRLPAHIDALPLGDERTAKCGAYFADLDRQAEGIILAAFPELNGKMLLAGGEATCDLDDFNREVTA